MGKIRMTANVLFAGIGCQERGFENSGVIDLRVRSISEIDRNAVMSYAAIHRGLTPEMVAGYDAYPAEEEMVRELVTKDIGYNAKTGKHYNWETVKKNREYIIKSNWLATHISHNLGNISKIESLPKADLWTVSFPCQDISCAGEMRGFKCGSGTRSSLLWEQIRLLCRAVEDETAPKFILLENVKGLLGKKFNADFLELLNVLDELGYNAEYKILNAKDFGIPQNRERVFVVCSRKGIDLRRFAFPEPFQCTIKSEDILNPKGDEGIFFNPDRLQKIAAMFKTGNVVLRNELSGAGKKICPDTAKGETAGKEVKEIPDENEKKTYGVSKLSPAMCFKLMGMTGADVTKCRKMGVSDTQLYRQAGNGIVTNCMQLIGEHLYKVLKDPSFICMDERKNGITWRKTPVFLLDLRKETA